MRRKLALGDWVGGVLRGPRAVYAVAPLFLPLIFASVQADLTTPQQQSDLAQLLRRMAPQVLAPAREVGPAV